MKNIFSLKKKLAGYSAMAGVVLAVSQQETDAQVIYHDIDPDVILTYSSGYSFDLNNDDTVDFSMFIGSSSAPRVRLYCRTSEAILDRYDNIIAALGSCQEISSVAPFPYAWDSCPTGGSNCYGELLNEYWDVAAFPWHDATHKFVPLVMHDYTGSHYGWIRMTHAAGMDHFVIEDYAYEATPDSAIVTPCATPVKDVYAPNLFNAFVQDHHLIIHFLQSQFPSQMILLNEAGVKIREQAITQSELVMDVNHLATGVYLVEVTDGEKRDVKKVVIR